MAQYKSEEFKIWLSELEYFTKRQKCMIDPKHKEIKNGRKSD